MDADWPSTLDAQRQADGRRTGPELPAANQLQPAALPLDRAATSILILLARTRTHDPGLSNAPSCSSPSLSSGIGIILAHAGSVYHVHSRCNATRLQHGRVASVPGHSATSVHPSHSDRLRHGDVTRLGLSGKKRASAIRQRATENEAAGISRGTSAAAPGASSEDRYVVVHAVVGFVRAQKIGMSSFMSSSDSSES